MRKIFYALLSFVSITAIAQTPLTFHDYSAVTIDHDTISMSQFYGKKVMVVNTASFCAYTPQFTDLESLYTNYKQYGFEIIGFPCNDFGNQDPHSDSTIEQFCTSNYNVTFQMMSKVATISHDTSEIYKWLQRADLNGVSNAHVAWNFNKFLIDEAGHWVRYYNQNTLPTDPAIISWIVDSASVVSGINETKNAKLVEITSANPGQVIDFTVSVQSAERLNIGLYSVDGRLVATIFEGAATKSQRISYNASNFNAGVYLVRVAGNTGQQTLKYVLTK